MLTEIPSDGPYTEGPLGGETSPFPSGKLPTEIPTEGEPDWRPEKSKDGDNPFETRPSMPPDIPVILIPSYSDAPKVESKQGGGSYNEVDKYVKREGLENQEKHHMPADSTSHLETGDGPCIAMEKEDHMQTASWGSSREAKEYRQKQRELIEDGKFREALQMDIDDIHEKFGDKYDDQINEMLAYVDELEKAGMI